MHITAVLAWEGTKILSPPSLDFSIVHYVVVFRVLEDLFASAPLEDQWFSGRHQKKPTFMVHTRHTMCICTTRDSYIGFSCAVNVWRHPCISIWCHLPGVTRSLLYSTVEKSKLCIIIFRQLHFASDFCVSWIVNIHIPHISPHYRWIVSHFLLGWRV